MKPRYEFTYINTWMCVLLCLLEIYTVKGQNLSSHVMKLDTNEWNPHGNLSKATHKQSYIYKCVSVWEREREREREMGLVRVTFCGHGRRRGHRSGCHSGSWCGDDDTAGEVIRKRGFRRRRRRRRE